VAEVPPKPETSGIAPPTEEHVLNLLRGVIDPELGSDIVELGMAKGARVADDGVVEVDIALTTAGCPLRAQIQKDIRARIGNLPGVTKVKIVWGELTQDEKREAMAKARLNLSREEPETAIPATTKCIMVASGKGGVGKSSLTVNLAAGLAERGFAVGVLDADIWGYSVPRMLGVDGRLEASVDSKKMTPHRLDIGDGHLEIVSMGFLVDNDATSLNWRGLILNRAVRHFIEDVAWGDLDYLLIDMPPGTGDVQMGLAKLLPRAEMIVITTPAQTAQSVAVRVGNMARSYYLRVAGVIENMTAFVNEEGKTYELFGRGGGQALATELGVPLLGSIPIDGDVAAGGDEGRPTILGEGPAAMAMRAVVDIIVEEAIPPVEMAGCSARLLDAARDSIANPRTTTAVTID
jgi:ATP-binding protein involved in chromosome partitioning